VQSVDDAVWRLAGRVRNAPTTVAAELLSAVGGVWINWGLRLAAAALLVARRWHRQLVALTLAVLTSELLIGPVKALYDRPRPPGSLIGTTAASFPSGHAIAGAVTAVSLVVVLIPPGRRRLQWEIWAIVFAFVMASSRVYLRAHWLSDAVAGALLGGGLAVGWPAVLQTVHVRRGQPVRPAPARSPAGSRPGESP
jgi:undecaprenyl-diphosphatase